MNEGCNVIVLKAIGPSKSLSSRIGMSLSFRAHFILLFKSFCLSVRL
jgi:hypothetical protein